MLSGLESTIHQQPYGSCFSFRHSSLVSTDINVMATVGVWGEFDITRNNESQVYHVWPDIQGH